MDDITGGGGGGAGGRGFVIGVFFNCYLMDFFFKRRKYDGMEK